VYKSLQRDPTGGGCAAVGKPGERIRRPVEGQVVRESLNIQDPDGATPRSYGLYRWNRRDTRLLRTDGNAAGGYNTTNTKSEQSTKSSIHNHIKGIFGGGLE